MAKPDKDIAADEEEPLFNIGAVSRMTDISETTLRIWERRYDFPQPVRTAGGHRLYSGQEIMRLKWVKRRVDEGMRVSQAIQALHLADKEEGSAAAVSAAYSSAAQPMDNGALSAFRERLVQALIAHDAESANRMLSEEITLYPLEQVVFEVIGPILFEIGERWWDGSIDVATEHFATNVLRHNLLIWRRTSPPAFQVAPVILACAPGELHEGSLLMLGLLLQWRRWPTVYLGQSVPLEDLAVFMDQLEPSILVFVAMTEETARSLIGWPNHLLRAARTGQPIVGYGGRAFIDHPELTDQVPGVWLGKTLQAGLETLDRMLHDLNPLLR
jgi:DNA-binding transcriptional MerR regulator